MTIALKRSTAAAAALTVSAVLLTGCAGGFTGGDNKSDDKKAEPSTSASQESVDLAALDTGKYPTEPRKPFGTATDDEILEVEGQRMAQFTVLPFEVDDDLQNVSPQVGVAINASRLSMVWSQELVKVPANDAVLYGFITSASTPDSALREGESRTLQNIVVRYLTADDAQAAADQMYRAALDRPDDKADTIEGLPDTKAVRGVVPGSDDLTTLALTPHNTYVLYQWYQSTPKNKDMHDKVIKQTVEKQTDLIDKFPKAPTKDEAKAAGTTGSTRPKMDQNKVLIYALPMTDEEFQKGGTQGSARRAVYGPRGMAAQSSAPEVDYNLLTDTGSIVAMERSNVYRAEEDEGAEKIMKTFVQTNKSHGYKVVDSPKGLPNATCMSQSGDSKSPAACFVVNGRYMGEISGKNLKDAHQATSAQYVIFTKADQKASNSVAEK